MYIVHMNGGCSQGGRGGQPASNPLDETLTVLVITAPILKTRQCKYLKVKMVYEGFTAKLEIWRHFYHPKYTMDKR